MALALVLTLLLLSLWLGAIWWHTHKPLPPGLDLSGPWCDATDLHLLYDETFHDEHGHRHCRQAIFDEILRLIGQAQRLLVIDIFQFNAPGESAASHRALASELHDALLRRKAEVPELEIVVISDPINSVYGGRPAPHFARLRHAGIHVVITDLKRTRDPNPSWSAAWRLAIGWLGNTSRGGWLANPLGPGKVTLRSYLALLNFNANHRKTLVADQGETWTAVVGSSNADDASSDYQNIALRFSGPVVLDLLNSELAIAGWSGLMRKIALSSATAVTARPGSPSLRLVTEGAVRDALLSIINEAQSEERLDVAVLYLSHRGIIRSLKRAQQRGVTIRLLLDPNKTHFGHASPGIPNRQAAQELHRAGLAIRWYDTHSEQAHSKVLLRSGGKRPAELLLGSANFTRRSLDNLNLEADVALHAPPDHPVISDIQVLFQRHWHNTDGESFSVPFAAYADSSKWRYWRYRLVEASGWSTF